jgi:DNA-binding beta-propeller fold protein YncE
MDHSARSLTLAACAVLTAGCGDPFLILGDAPGVIRVVAGTPEISGDSLGDWATESHLNLPHGLAVGPDGTVYIADQSNARILAVNPSGGIAILVDHSSLNAEPRLRRPDGLALDGRGGLAITDPEGERIWRLQLGNGGLEPIAGGGAAAPGTDSIDALQVKLARPTGIAIEPDGRIFFTEELGNRVRRIDADGLLTTLAGTGGLGFSGDGGLAREATLRRPTGLAIAGGSLYVADSDNHRVRAIELSTSIIETVAGSGVPGFDGDGGLAKDAALDNPRALAVTDEDHFLFIADVNNDRVRLVNLATGTISTFAGTGDDRFSGELLAAGETSLSAPHGLATSSFGLLFISDTGHHIVLRAVIDFMTSF